MGRSMRRTRMFSGEYNSDFTLRAYLPHPLSYPVVLVMFLLYFASVFIAHLVNGITGVQINFVRVPGAVRNNSGTASVLDCDYTVRPDDEGLVVKWFLNGGPHPVYQWIPPKKPQALGILKNRLDLSYKISNDPKMAYRALRIINPTTDIAGDYKCFVSTFTDEDFSSKYMIVFEPEEKLTMYLGVPVNDQVNFTCIANGVYPEPKVIMYKNTEDRVTYEPKSIMDVVEWTKSRHQSGKYDLSIVVSSPIDELIPGEIIDCELRIPGTGYVKKKSIIYYPPLEKNTSASILSLVHIVLVITVWIVIFI